MKYKRIIALVSAIVIVFNIAFISVSATSSVAGGYFTAIVSSFFDWFIDTSITGMMDSLPWMWDAHQKATNDPCATSPTGHHDFTLKASIHSPTLQMETCKYCGVTWSSFYLDAERGFVDGLENTTVTNPISATMLYNGVELPNIDTVWTDKETYPYVTIALKSSTSSGYRLYITSVPIIVTGGLFGVSADGSYSRNSISDGDSEWIVASFKSISAGSTFGSSQYLVWSNHDIFNSDGTLFVAATVPVNPNVSAGDPSIPDSASRPTSIMDVITKWNKDNPIGTNSPTINYYITPTNSDDFYDPSLYDDEELVYTDPVTGTQYLTSGWTYDYLTRCYTLDMADDTFTIGSTVIDTIKLTYGDELLTVDHYSGGSLIRSDEYNYVMASGSECGLNGHSYTYETVKEPSCIAAGERKYTCSICGDEYAEEIPMGSHAYEYSVIKEASCISGGTTANTCRICGDQTVEHLPELGHDWQETGSTTTTYALPEGTSCPDCAGADFAAALDEAAGTYSCTCNGCGTVWTVSAVITYGVTTYTCTRCGTTKTETDDPESGLFDSIGNLIADGITWATEKLKQLVENLSGINDIFNDYADSVRENTGQYPALLGAIIALMPEDFMIVVWFGIVALVVLAVWKKWFS